MAAALMKFTGVWLAGALLCAALIFFTNGRPDTLSEAYQSAQLAKCQTVRNAFAPDSKQQCIAQATRQLERRAMQARSDLLLWHFETAVAVLALGLAFMVLIVNKASTACTVNDFKSMKGSWFAFLLAIGLVALTAAIAAQAGILGFWATMVEPSRAWGIPAALIVVWAATFWIGTRVSTPETMLPSIPGA